MEGFSQNMPSEIHSYGFGSSTQHYGGAPPAPQNIMDNLNPPQSFIAQTHTTTSQVDNSGTGIVPTPGTSLQEDYAGEVVVPQNSGRKKKKKHKSGESNPGSSVKPEVMDEEGLVDAAIPLLTENQDVEDLLLSGNLTLSEEAVLGGQHLLNNSLLDQILTEKKLQLMQSPEVMEWLKKHIKDK